jgi:hypothetical protein
MTFRGLLTCSVVLACLLVAAPAFAQGGGAAAPAAPAPQADAAVAEPEGPPVADATAPEGVAAQEPEPPEPTVPGGEEQPDGAPDGIPEDGAPNGETIAQGGGGTLPRTGMEVLSLAMIGLGLLLAGGALWPTSSWPPPRDRLSRSMPR